MTPDGIIMFRSDVRDIYKRTEPSHPCMRLCIGRMLRPAVSKGRALACFAGVLARDYRVLAIAGQQTYFVYTGDFGDGDHAGNILEIEIVIGFEVDDALNAYGVDV